MSGKFWGILTSVLTVVAAVIGLVAALINSHQSTSSPRVATTSTHSGPDTRSAAGSASPSTSSTPPVESWPKYLSNMQEADGNATFDAGSVIIDKKNYPDSVSVCSQVDIVNASCNSSSAWGDYNVPTGYSVFKAALGFSNKSPSDCAVDVEISGDRQSLYTNDIKYGYSIAISRPIGKYQRMRLQVSPQRGDQCEVAFGNAEFVP